MKGTFIAFSVLLLCSCKKGAMPLHSAYVYDQRTQAQTSEPAPNFTHQTDCSNNSACLALETAVPGSAQPNAQHHVETCILD